ncbi:MAG: hypothetical protein JNL98_38635 [Bryobacterales bacterium]|nr:hypothetical protein [Bryobacterales bacterium]
MTPRIDFEQEIAKVISVGNTTLEGVYFVAKDHKALTEKLRQAVAAGGDKAFVESGLKGAEEHWAIDLSFGATDGKGFREIWRPKLSDRPLIEPGGRYGGYRMNPDMRFGDAVEPPDYTSLHCAIGSGKCNIHIDEMGFVMTGPDGKLVLNPDFVRHIVDEFLFKTVFRGFMPGWIQRNVMDRLSLNLPSTPVGFNDRYRLKDQPVGLKLDLKRGENYRLSIAGSCTAGGKCVRQERAVTLTLSGRF